MGTVTDNMYPAALMAINGLTSAPNPPTYNSGNGWAAVPPSWANGAVETFDVRVYSQSANAITGLRLLAGTLETITIADDVVESIASNELTLTSHGYVTGDGPVRMTNSGGALPTGITAGTNYWVVVTGANTIKLAEDLYRALTNKTITVSGGSGTNTIEDVVTGNNLTSRVFWDVIGYLGEANDGAVTLAVSSGSPTGYKALCTHSQDVVAYSATGTFGSAVATFVKLRPRNLVRAGGAATG